MNNTMQSINETYEKYKLFDKFFRKFYSKTNNPYNGCDYKSWYVEYNCSDNNKLLCVYVVGEDIDDHINSIRCFPLCWIEEEEIKSSTEDELVDRLANRFIEEMKKPSSDRIAERFVK